MFSSPHPALSLATARRLAPLALLVVTGAFAACGEPTDREQDCTVNEFFDEGDRLCTSCPALLEPSCREGCGFTIATDDLGCPAAECDLDCSLCDEGSVWSPSTLSCEPEACPPGEFQDEQGDCLACPAQEDPPTDCTQLPCQGCQLVSLPDDRGCPQLVCALCAQAPQDMSAQLGEGGRCLTEAQTP